MTSGAGWRQGTKRGVVISPGDVIASSTRCPAWATGKAALRVAAGEIGIADTQGREPQKTWKRSAGYLPSPR